MMYNVSHQICRNTQRFCVLLRYGWFNPYHAGTELSRFNWDNIIAADAPAPSTARPSAAMILTMWNRQDLVFGEEGLIGERQEAQILKFNITMQTTFFQKAVMSRIMKMQNW